MTFTVLDVTEAMDTGSHQELDTDEEINFFM